MSKRSTTTKDVALLHQLLKDEQLRLAPEFQRNAVWPSAAKAYLIDTILSERPMPLFFFQRGRSAQTGKPVYSIVDGQQRLRSIFEFLDDRFPLSQSKDKRFSGKTFSKLSKELKERIWNYDLTIEELSGYNDDDVRDVFARMNKYVVKLSPQELRHAREKGAFYDFIEELGRLPYWREQRVFSIAQYNRMRASEFAAELVILLIEGPQDKKGSIDLYYGEYQVKFTKGGAIRGRLLAHLAWIKQALPTLSKSRFRKPVDLYSLITALDELLSTPKKHRRIEPEATGRRLTAFERELASKNPNRRALLYLAAASRQTDNIGPRTIRSDILKAVLVGRDD